jgi:Cof subfamily protein (haloacid dehalogenase superfamily)
MRYKLLVSDIDGTIVGSSGKVSPENKDALKRAVNSGITVSLCTGRSLTGCLPLLKELGLEGCHIFHDGALVLNPATKQEIYAEAIDPESISQAVSWTHAHNMEIELYASNAYYAERVTWSTETHLNFFHTRAMMVDYFDIIGRERIIKLGSIARDSTEKKLIESFCKAFEGIFNFSWVTSPSFLGVDFLNIISPLVSKGCAVNALAKHLGIERDAILAIGDGTNDITMIAAAGFGIAMGQSVEELKSRAAYITGHVDENGLAQAISKLLF